MTQQFANVSQPSPQSDSRAFFAEATPFPLPGALLGLMLVTNLVSAVVTLAAAG